MRTISHVLVIFCSRLVSQVIVCPSKKLLSNILPLKSYRVFIKYFVFSEFLKIFPTLAFLCFPSVSVCVHTHQAGRKPALQQSWQILEKSQNLKEKTQYLMNTLQHHINGQYLGFRIVKNVFNNLEIQYHLLAILQFYEYLGKKLFHENNFFKPFVRWLFRYVGGRRQPYQPKYNI